MNGSLLLQYRQHDSELRYSVVDSFDRQDATRAPEALSWTFNIQRQLASKTVLQFGYNATVGTHLQSGILNYNQVPTAAFNNLVQQFGATQALNLLRSDITSAAARSAGGRIA